MRVKRLVLSWQYNVATIFYMLYGMFGPEIMEAYGWVALLPIFIVFMAGSLYLDSKVEKRAIELYQQKKRELH